MGSRKFWMIAVALWMLMFGLLALTNIQFKAQDVVMGVLALAVAVLIAFDK